MPNEIEDPFGAAPFDAAKLRKHVVKQESIKAAMAKSGLNPHQASNPGNQRHVTNLNTNGGKDLISW